MELVYYPTQNFFARKIINFNDKKKRKLENELKLLDDKQIS